MLLDRIFPNRCSSAGDELRRAAELHALSTIELTTAARKQQRRVKDMRVTVDAAEQRVEHRNRQIATLNALLERDR
ncbi:hypothetical protein PUR29_33175 [Methylobacterium ajmalii]|uniref:Uncharacterized protein n=1 Tax=Methylobacterium ajmalii TaxID=2738439 RepID=A0ABV0A4N9_9HYPH|nr:hypothetical protein [Methylobacterium sp. ap11]SEP21194.1 hypothetical protein SAMN04487843_108192 [Methylobacterium sp. ap11]